MTTDRFEQIKAQYRRWPGDTEPNGNWGADVSWLIDEVERLRANANKYKSALMEIACTASIGGIVIRTCDNPKRVARAALERSDEMDRYYR